MSDELIEKVARAMCAAEGPLTAQYVDSEWVYWQDNARASIAIVRAAAIEECRAKVRTYLINENQEIADNADAILRALDKGDASE